ncbi:MAG: S1 RNA-binding domain-containing protein [Patescibacteria group bacterium]
MSLSKTSVNNEPQTMEELMAQTGATLPVIKRGQMVNGKILNVSGHEVLIDIGSKAPAVLGEKEWDEVSEYVKSLKPGDAITAYVIAQENDMGQTVVSFKGATVNWKWNRAKTAKESGEILTIRTLEVNKGGVTAIWEGLRGFVPASQLDPLHVSNMSYYVNRPIKAKTIEVNHELNRLIFSERAVLEAVNKEANKEELDKMQVGEVYDAEIAGVVPYGLFIKYGKLEGLIHISEISWEKIDDLKALYIIGDRIKAKLLGIEEQTGKLNLSLKQLQEDPWLKIAGKYQKDQVVSGKISKITPYGAFVEIAPGITGLIHITKVPVGIDLAENQEAECVIENIDPAARKIGLSVVLKEKPVGYK